MFSSVLCTVILPTGSCFLLFQIAPENTAIAFNKAIKFGVFGLESDVRIR